MFYKIESGYNDYFTVKRDVFDKKEYMYVNKGEIEAYKNNRKRL